VVAELLINDREVEGKTDMKLVVAFPSLRTRLKIPETDGKVIALSINNFHNLQRFPHTSPPLFTVMLENTFAVTNLLSGIEIFV
jgi:hypothetical protein